MHIYIYICMHSCFMVRVWASRFRSISLVCMFQDLLGSTVAVLKVAEGYIEFYRV